MCGNTVLELFTAVWHLLLIISQISYQFMKEFWASFKNKKALLKKYRLFLSFVSHIIFWNAVLLKIFIFLKQNGSTLKCEAVFIFQLCSHRLKWESMFATIPVAKYPRESSLASAMKAAFLINLENP